MEGLTWQGSGNVWPRHECMEAQRRGYERNESQRNAEAWQSYEWRRRHEVRPWSNARLRGVPKGLWTTTD